jgi:hypothetical protein
LVYDGIALALSRWVVPREPLIQDSDFVSIHYTALLSSDRPVHNDSWACTDWKSNPSFLARRRILSPNVSLVSVLKYALAVYSVEPIRLCRTYGSGVVRLFTVFIFYRLLSLIFFAFSSAPPLNLLSRGGNMFRKTPLIYRRKTPLFEEHIF